MLDRAVEAAIIFLGAYFEERLPAALISWFTWLKEYETWVKIAYWVGLVLLFLLVSWFIRGGSRRVACLRRWRFEQAKFEGVWVQQVTNERPHSISAIEYVGSEGKWRYYGAGFDERYQLRAEWETSETFYDERRRVWHFAGGGKLLEESTGVPREINAFDIAVIMTLRREPRLGFHAKAADFNFSRPIDGNQERVFSIEAHPANQKFDVIEHARTMTQVQRRALFQP